MNAADREHAGNPPSGADDDLAADLFAEDPVRRADVTGLLRGDGRGLEPEAVLANRLGGFVDDLVVGRPPPGEREIEAWKRQLDAHDIGSENPQRGLEQLLSRLIAFEDDDGSLGHGRQSSRSHRCNRHERIDVVYIANVSSWVMLGRDCNRQHNVEEEIVARKTVLVCDNCGTEVDEGKGAILRVTFNDARRGAKQADLCDSCAGGMPGAAVARRGRKPKSMQ